MATVMENLILARERLAFEHQRFTEYANAARELLLPIIEETSAIFGEKLTIGQPTICKVPEFELGKPGCFKNGPTVTISVGTNQIDLWYFQVTNNPVNSLDTVSLHNASDGERLYSYSEPFIVPYPPGTVNRDDKLKQVHGEYIAMQKYGFPGRALAL